MLHASSGLGLLTGLLRAALLFLPCAAAAQNFPFPYTGTYVAGFRPSNLATADARAIYDTWKSEYLKTDCGAGLTRVEFNNPAGSTASEGQGYGMVLTAYYGDQAAFDGLWAYAKKNFNSNGLMGKHTTCSGFTTNDGGAGAAADGDTDIGMGLVVAAYQWGGAYNTDALVYLAKLRRLDFNDCAAGVVMANDGFGNGCAGSNTSYWMPGYYRVFAQFTGDPSFETAADTALSIWAKAAHPTTGLVSNEVDQNGATTSPNVDYNGCRIPWRAVLDYLWYGTAGAKAFTDKITAWVDSNGGGVNLLDGYKTDGTPIGTSNGSDCFNGGYATGAMSASQDRVDRFTTYFKSLPVDNYSETSLRALYMLMLSGAFWKPSTSLPFPDGGVLPVDAGARDAGPGGDAAVDGGRDAALADAGANDAALDAGSSDGGPDAGAADASAGASEAAATETDPFSCSTVSGSVAGLGALPWLLALLAKRRRRTPRGSSRGGRDVA